MRFLSSMLAVALCGLLFVAADSAEAQRLDAVFLLEDQTDTNTTSRPSASRAPSLGSKESSSARAPGGDVVEIVYFTNTPTSVNADDEQARVRQSGFSELQFSIASAVDARDLDLTQHPAKGSGEDLFAEVTADQLASIQAAFLNASHVKIKVKSDGSKGSIAIKGEGPALDKR